MSKPLKPILKFANEVEERAFWENTTPPTMWTGLSLNVRVPYQSLTKAWLKEKLRSH